MKIIDSHCHIDWFKNIDLPKIIEDVSEIYAVSISYESSLKVLDIASKYSTVKVALGIHPEYFEYYEEFEQIRKLIIKNRDKLPILCGGSGLYVESVLRGYSLVNVPENKELRSKYADYSLQALTQILESYKTLHNKTDVDTAQRAIRAIEIVLVVRRIFHLQHLFY